MRFTKLTAVLTGMLLFYPTLKGQELDRALIPIRPSELLSCLPKETPEWRMVVSNASPMRLAVPTSKATRKFEFVGIDPSGKPVQPDAPKISVQLTLMDVGSNSDAIAVYKPLPPGTEDGTRGERITIHSMAGIRYTNPDKSQRIELASDNRYILVMEMNGESTMSNVLDKWVGMVNWPAIRELGRKSKTISMLENNLILMERVDEMNPKRNKVTRAYIGLRPEE